MVAVESSPLYNRRYVALGGGTGLFYVLRGAVDLVNSDGIVAIPGTWDDGGSTGQLRTDLGILPPGDPRRCVVALMPTDKAREIALEIFEKRPRKHPIGNLLLAELNRYDPGNFLEAAKELFSLKGAIYPVTLNPTKLIFKDVNGREERGEHQLDERKRIGTPSSRPRITSVGFANRPRTNPRAIEAIKNADKLIISMGSLFGSILPHFRVPGVREAILESKAELFYVMNLMTEAGQTDQFSAADHLRHIVRGIGDPSRLDYIVVSDQRYIRVNGKRLAVGPGLTGVDKHSQLETLVRYEEENQNPVQVNETELLRIAPKAKILKVGARVYEPQNLIRHDHEELTQVIVSPDQVQSEYIKQSQ